VSTHDAADQAAVCPSGPSGLRVVSLAIRLAGPQAMGDELSFKVVRPNDHDHDEVLARAVNLLARGAYRAAVRMYPNDLIELRQGARVIERSK
jgi:hypothetical protein